jgi:hypothetical protein
VRGVEVQLSARNRIGLAGPLAAAACVAMVLLAVPDPGIAPGMPRVQSWLTEACGGADPCDHWAAVQAVEALLQERMGRVPEEERMRIADALVGEAEEARIDPLFVLALIEVESGFDQDAVSNRGAMGLMQLKPATLLREATRSNLDLDDPTDPVLNVRAGIRYYRRLLDAFRQNDELALMAYNAGPQRISHFLHGPGIPARYRGYPRRVRAELHRLRADRRIRSALPDALLASAEER